MPFPFTPAWFKQRAERKVTEELRALQIEAAARLPREVPKPMQFEQRNTPPRRPADLRSVAAAHASTRPSPTPPAPAPYRSVYTPGPSPAPAPSNDDFTPGYITAQYMHSPAPSPAPSHSCDSDSYFSSSGGGSSSDSSSSSCD